jgi:hypothetical protein
VEQPDGLGQGLSPATASPPQAMQSGQTSHKSTPPTAEYITTARFSEIISSKIYVVFGYSANNTGWSKYLNFMANTQQEKYGTAQFHGEHSAGKTRNR